MNLMCLIFGQWFRISRMIDFLDFNLQSLLLFFNGFTVNFIFKYINRQNNHVSGSSYINIQINRTLYMSCQAGVRTQDRPL